jgi:hypothetical protein
LATNDFGAEAALKITNVADLDIHFREFLFHLAKVWQDATLVKEIGKKWGKTPQIVSSFNSK